MKSWEEEMDGGWGLKETSYSLWADAIHLGVVENSQRILMLKLSFLVYTPG